MNIFKSTTLQRQRQTMTGPRLQFRQIGSVAYQAIAGWVEHNDSNMGAALAFYTMFAIAPILVIAVAVAGYVFGPQVAETQVLQQLSALIGDTGAKAIRDLLLSAHYSDQKGFAAALGIITLLVGGNQRLRGAAIHTRSDLEYATGEGGSVVAVRSKACPINRAGPRRGVSAP